VSLEGFAECLELFVIEAKDVCCCEPACERGRARAVFGILAVVPSFRIVEGGECGHDERISTRRRFGEFEAPIEHPAPMLDAVNARTRVGVSDKLLEEVVRVMLRLCDGDEGSLTCALVGEIFILPRFPETG
jgi:hypothetical protein